MNPPINRLRNMSHNFNEDAKTMNLPADQYTKNHESFQAHPYIDPKGNKRIGHGFKMDEVTQHLPHLVNEGKRPLTKQESEVIFNKMYAKARKKAQVFADDKWHSLTGQQQKSLIDIAYTGHLSGMKKLKKHIQEGNHHSASHEIMNSEHAKEYPTREQRNAKLIQS